MRVSNPAMRAIAEQMERDEIVRWSANLARARVTRWGGMISTPDDALQVTRLAYHTASILQYLTDYPFFPFINGVIL